MKQNNQREWEKEFDDEWGYYEDEQKGYGGLTFGYDDALVNDDIKQFISSLLQSERQRVYDEVIDVMKKQMENIPESYLWEEAGTAEYEAYEWAMEYFTNKRNEE